MEAYDGGCRLKIAQEGDGRGRSLLGPQNENRPLPKVWWWCRFLAPTGTMVGNRLVCRVPRSVLSSNVNLYAVVWRSMLRCLSQGGRFLDASPI
jgi:hypothetical protein